MSKVTLTYNIVDYTPATASPVDSNFDRVEQHINQELVERDGTVAMRAQLKLVGDPIAELDAAPKQYVDQVLPIGIIMMHGGTTAPPGGRWMVCNGAELQTATEPDLWNVIGHNFSPAGTPDSRFNLPNLTDRLPMGIGTLTTIGEKGGSKDAIVVTHQHNLANHTHTIAHDHGIANTSTTGSHSHTEVIGEKPPGSGGTTRIGPGEAGTNYGTMTTASNGSHYHTFNPPSYSGNSGGPTGDLTTNTGVAGTDKNLPPYLGVQFIIRAK